MKTQDRKYSRVNTRIKAYMRRTVFDDSLPLFSSTLVGDTDDHAVKNLYGSHLPRELINFLQQMDEKVNMILSLINRETIQADFPLQGEVLEISGAGLKFTSQEDFEEGENMEMVLLLSQVPLRIVGMVGRIHRCEKVQGVPVWAVQYASIRDVDREKIVQFVFQEQREHIRGRKNENEPG
ncbi:type IV pilus assembly PilZ [Desulfonatronospira thiodismutans ASO3-1]|uniref:Type IV pilus assembly PilZ n=1 Tax=Desulfonatronospira thiodismutans ASO3-1 TaxID=555779 RepID=D6SPF6_9BACT|nr:PilZ domain-containing protein [Desulfonatronospira thiodismutans]EFI34632.1 type IV pilus assembly PilZ [Desulfonatronospira thiodismutans ASO3-1]